VLRPIALVGALLLAGCMATTSQDRFLTKYADPDPSLDAVVVCHGYGCRLQQTVDLGRQWAALVAPLAEAAPDAETERAHLAEVLGAFEHEVGARTGTSGDLGGTLAGFGQDGQLDCIDEAINTTTYLTLMERAGLLAWHHVRAPMSRGFFVNGWPHTSAVVAEMETGASFAIDTWFHDNGMPAEVVALDIWLAGWDPEDGPDERIVVTAAQTAAEVTVPPRTP
jgi:hypothetical protein